MTKYFLSAIALVIITTTSFGQATKTKLDQVKSDPTTTQNTAKADAQLINKKNVLDSTIARNILLKRKKHPLNRQKKLPYRSS
jgi:hypothetical protein